MSGVPQALAVDEDFRGKWLAREPEMALVERFAPASGQAVLARWGALVAELRQAAFEADPQVAQLKRAWWVEELQRFAAGEPRHPLGRGVDPVLPWTPLAQALMSVGGGPQRPEDAAEARHGMLAFATALAAVEAAWAGLERDPDAVEATVVHLLSQRLWVGLTAEDAARIPMNLFARHGVGRSQLGQAEAAPVIADWAETLLAMAPVRLGQAAPYRHLRWVMDRELLAHCARKPGAPWKPGPRVLWRSWRAGRRLQR